MADVSAMFFNYVYAASKIGLQYNIGSTAIGFGELSPSGTNVRVVDDIVDSPVDHPDVLSSFMAGGAEKFSVSAGSLMGTYTYIGGASVAGFPNWQNFLAQNEAGSYFYFTNTKYSFPYSGPIAPINVSPFQDVWICFMAGTRVATPSAAREQTIECLNVGDLIVTSDGRTAPIRWIGRQTVSTLFADENRLPVRIKTGALGDNVPCRDLLVSNDHGLLVEGVLVQAGALINGVTIVRERNVPTVFTYYHVELDDHSLILAENVPAETFVDNVERYAFDNWDAYQALYPAGRSVPEMDLPRVKAQRQLPSAVRKLLDARVAALGAVAAA